jgi:hypothetical protein
MAAATHISSLIADKSHVEKMFEEMWKATMRDMRTVLLHLRAEGSSKNFISRSSDEGIASPNKNATAGA